MKKAWWLLLLLVIPSVSAYSLADWPKFFVTDGKFSAKYVVAEESSALDVVSATIISTSLAKFENVTTEVGTSVLDSEVSDIKLFNAIVVGSPCENSAAARLMNNPEPCYKDLAGSVGYIKLFQSGGRVQLLITGLDEKDRNSAAKYLAEKSLSNVNVTEYLVPSNSGSTPVFFEQKFFVKNESNVSNVSVQAPVVNVSSVKAEVHVKNVSSVKPKVGKYEPLESVPKKKGFFASFWSWLKSLFS